MFKSILASLCSSERHFGQNLDSGAGFSSCFTRVKLPSPDDHQTSVMIVPAGVYSRLLVQ
jgi:hypothetical protein